MSAPNSPSDSNNSSDHILNLGHRRPWRREPMDWLAKQKFWLELSAEQKEDWLRWREVVSFQHEDPLVWREDEFFWMSLEDVPELSRLHFAETDEDSVEDLRRLRELWRHLGGGPRIAARLEVVGGPMTPRRWQYSEGHDDDECSPAKFFRAS